MEKKQTERMRERGREKRERKGEREREREIVTLQCKIMSTNLIDMTKFYVI